MVETQIGISAVQQAIFNQRVAARIEEATRWAFWRNGEEVCGYSTCRPIALVREEIIREEAGRRPPQALEGS
jgi:hypothetical protein